MSERVAGPATQVPTPGRSPRPAGIVGVLVLASAAGVVLSVGVGSVWIPPLQVLSVVADQVVPGSGWADVPAVQQRIVWEFRVLRALLGFLVGASLAVAGAVLQAAHPWHHGRHICLHLHVYTVAMTTATGPRLPRSERREQSLAVATGLFARTRPADLTLADVAREAGITRAIVYRHVESKDDLYRRTLQRARALIESAVGPAPYDASIVPRLFEVAAEHPDEFRLLFVQAPREPDAADLVADHRRAILGAAADGVGATGAGEDWDEWTRRLVPELTLAAVVTWLDAGAPRSEAAGDHLLRLLERAVQRPGG